MRKEFTFTLDQRRSAPEEGEARGELLVTLELAANAAIDAGLCGDVALGAFFFGSSLGLSSLAVWGLFGDSVPIIPLLLFGLWFRLRLLPRSLLREPDLPQPILRRLEVVQRLATSRSDGLSAFGLPVFLLPVGLCGRGLFLVRCGPEVASPRFCASFLRFSASLASMAC
jgi:hypothetical protein